MREHKNRISTLAVRNANERLVARTGKSTHIISDYSKNGVIAFKVAYIGKTFDINISKVAIKSAYAKSIEETIL